MIVINKLKDDRSDSDLFLEIMQQEIGADEFNNIRTKLMECFNGITVVGVPFIELQNGEEFGYPVLNERFRDALKNTSNKIIENLTEIR